MTECIVKCISFVLIFLNFSIRTVCPSQYVPYQRTCKNVWGDPYFARTLATFAEFAFYRQVTQSLDIQDLWYSDKGVGSLLILWMNAESLSWFGLVFQSYEANALEDVLWCVWFTLAFVYGKNNIRYVLLPIVVYYICFHIPQLVKDYQQQQQQKVLSYVSTLDASGSWVVPSVAAKLVFYILFVYLELIFKK